MKFIINNSESKSLSKKINELEEASAKVLSQANPSLYQIAKDHPIEISFISDAEIQKLNKVHRQKDKPTDVLSWGFLNSELQANEICGEIYISTETCQRQAKEKNHSTEYEIIYLITHGLLHIFEYDHQTDEQEQEMNKVQQSIMSRLQIAKAA